MNASERIDRVKAILFDGNKVPFIKELSAIGVDCAVAYLTPKKARLLIEEGFCNANRDITSARFKALTENLLNNFQTTTGSLAFDELGDNKDGKTRINVCAQLAAASAAWPILVWFNATKDQISILDSGTPRNPFDHYDLLNNVKTTKTERRLMRCYGFIVTGNVDSQSRITIGTVKRYKKFIKNEDLQDSLEKFIACWNQHYARRCMDGIIDVFFKIWITEGSNIGEEVIVAFNSQDSVNNPYARIYDWFFGSTKGYYHGNGESKRNGATARRSILIKKLTAIDKRFKYLTKAFG